MPRLIEDCQVPECPPEADAKAIFRSMEYDDMWDDADLRSCIHYLRGSTSLRIPAGWRELLPTSI